MPPAPSRISRGCRLKTSSAGALLASCSFITLANTGVSLIFSRTKRPTATSRKESRNGTRQPHEWNASSSSVVDRIQKMPVAAKKPTDGPS